MNSKRAWTLGILLVIVAAAAAAVILRRRPAQHDHDHDHDKELLQLLPPDFDIYAVADLRSLDANPVIRKLLSDPPGVPRDADYEQFLQATGFHYQDDLKRFAVAKSGPDLVGAALVHVDRARIIRYLDSHGARKQDALGKTVFIFGRLRPFCLVFLEQGRGVASPGPGKAAGKQQTLVAFTIGGDFSRIRQAVARYLGERKDSAAVQIERRRDFDHIPPGSKIWMIAKPKALWGAGGNAARFGSFSLDGGLLRGSKMVYISLRSGPTNLYLQAENYCDTAPSARRIAGSLQTMLTLLKAMPQAKRAPSGKALADKDRKEASVASLLSGISIQQVQRSVLLRWQLDGRVLNFLEAKPR